MGTEIIIAIVLIYVVITKISVLLSKAKCVSKVSMAGKVVIVTGATRGLGFEAAKDLARRGARVILAGKDEKNTPARATRDRIRRETGNKNVVCKHLDLRSLSSVRQFSAHINSTEPRLDVLVNNAGVHGYGDRYTEDGIVEEMQVNYFGPFLLTLLLVPLLDETTSSRIVNVSSALHFFGRIDFNYINEKGYYWHGWTYTNSKLCIVMFTVELARRLQGSVTVNAVHPGIIMTNLNDKLSLIERFVHYFLLRTGARSVEEGAQTIIHLAVATEVANITGKYFVDCKERYMTWRARDKILATELWKYSESLVGFFTEDCASEHIHTY